MESEELAAYAAPEFNFDSFCRRVYPTLVGALTLHCGDRCTAEELAQESLTRFWMRRGEASRLDSPEAWVFRVAFNLANSRYRRLIIERRANRRSTPTHPATDDPTDALAVRAAVSALPKRQRSALVLRYFADLSVKQTAEAMGCAAGTVKALTSQAIDRLRADFEIEPADEESEARNV